jgi:hypothetical protein
MNIRPKRLIQQLSDGGLDNGGLRILGRAIPDVDLQLAIVKFDQDLRGIDAGRIGAKASDSDLEGGGAVAKVALVEFNPHSRLSVGWI